MKKVIGVILASIVAILSWVVVFLILVIVAAVVWEETMPAWYAFVLLIPPIGVSNVFGYIFYGKYKRKHNLDSNHHAYNLEDGCTSTAPITHGNREDNVNLIKTINELKHIIEIKV